MGNNNMFSNISDNIINYIIYVFLISIISFVFFYLYKRVNVLENSVIEHGKILQNFIQNYNYQIINSPIPNNKQTEYFHHEIHSNNNDANTNSNNNTNSNINTNNDITRENSNCLQKSQENDDS